MRLFVGLASDAAVRGALARLSDSLQACIPARYVPPELYHLTLAFLGQRGEESLPGLQAALLDTAASAEAFSLTLEGIGYFGRDTDAILYAAAGDCPALSKLADTLRSRLTAAGETFDEKPMVPHVTLARKARLATDLPTFPRFSIPYPVGALTLFHSARMEGQLRYLPVLNAALVQKV